MDPHSIKESYSSMRKQRETMNFIIKECTIPLGTNFKDSLKAITHGHYEQCISISHYKLVTFSLSNTILIQVK